jgi:hypothetical protein
MKNYNSNDIIKIDRPKIELRELMKFTLSFDNLQKYIDHLTNTDIYLGKEMSDVRMRLDRVEEQQKVTTEILFRLNVNEKRIDEIYKSISSIQRKIVDADQKLSTFEEVKN